MRSVLQSGPSIYHAMSARAAEFNAVDLAQGYPDLPGPHAVRERAAACLLNGPQQYTDPKGLKSLRLALAEDVYTRHCVQVDPETQVAVTAGAQDAIGCAMLGLLEPGDEVVLVEPFYNPCVTLAKMTGASVRFVSLTGPKWHLDEEELLSVMSPRTKLIVYNTPNNPSGHVFTEEELAVVARACERFDSYVLADEVYEHLVFAPHRHVSALSVPELRDRALVVSSFSKTYLMTGWRVGWAIGASSLVSAVHKVHQLLSFCLPAFLSEGARYALQELPRSYYEQFVKVHEEKRDRLCAGLEACGIVTHKPEGTIFCSIDVHSLGLPTDEVDDVAFCQEMPETIGVAGIPMSLSWADRRLGRNLVRLCFSKSDETIDKAVLAFGAWMDGRA